MSIKSLVWLVFQETCLFELSVGHLPTATQQAGQTVALKLSVRDLIYQFNQTQEVAR